LFLPLFLPAVGDDLSEYIADCGLVSTPQGGLTENHNRHFRRNPVWNFLLPEPAMNAGFGIRSSRLRFIPRSGDLKGRGRMTRSILFAATLAVVGLGIGTATDADWCADHSRQAQLFVRHVLEMKFPACPPRPA
jgi:hypothetical protein